MEGVPEKYTMHDNGIMKVECVKLTDLSTKALAVSVNLKCALWSAGALEFNSAANKNMLKIILADKKNSEAAEEAAEPLQGARVRLTLWGAVAERTAQELAAPDGIAEGKAVAVFNVVLKEFMQRAELSSTSAIFIKSGDAVAWFAAAQEDNFAWVNHAAESSDTSTLPERSLWAFSSPSGGRKYTAKVKITNLSVSEYTGCTGCNKILKLAPSAIGDYFCSKCDAFVADSKVVSQVDCKVSCPGDDQSTALKASCFPNCSCCFKSFG